MERHFTVTGFVVERGRALLHWHPKLHIWLPPGGHVEPDEDPVQAVLREVLEETGITAEIVHERARFEFDNVTQLPPPISIIVADVGSGAHKHQHIDFAYVVRPVAGAGLATPERDHGFVWVSAQQFENDEALPVPGTAERSRLAADVREVGLRAIVLEAGTNP